MNEYEALCDRMLRAKEAFVRDLRYQAASTGDPQVHHALRWHENELTSLRKRIMHTVADPAVARAIIFQSMLSGDEE